MNQRFNVINTQLKYQSYINYIIQKMWFYVLLKCIPCYYRAVQSFKDWLDPMDQRMKWRVGVGGGRRENWSYCKVLTCHWFLISSNQNISLKFSQYYKCKEFFSYLNTCPIIQKDSSNMARVKKCAMLILMPLKYVWCSFCHFSLQTL